MGVEARSSNSQKVVVQFGNKSVRGYLETPAWETIEDILSNRFSTPVQTIRVRILESDTIEEIQAVDVKAVFYVKTFQGDPVRNHINFHTRTPVVDGIWMRLEFVDGEIMEGIVCNSIRYLIDPGFFLIPTDPESNNTLVYVSKKCLAEHQILGLRRIAPYMAITKGNVSSSNSPESSRQRR